jgi:hypothetical protein
MDEWLWINRERSLVFELNYELGVHGRGSKFSDPRVLNIKSLVGLSKVVQELLT